MSIWCSGRVIGHDPAWIDDDEQVGDVRSYAGGWSNHYPDQTVEQPANIDTAHIPVWCVPGHRGEVDRVIGPWLRLCVQSWEHDFRNPTETVGQVNAAVVLDEAAVRALVDDLTDWLARPKAYPVEEQAHD